MGCVCIGFHVVCVYTHRIRIHEKGHTDAILIETHELDTSSDQLDHTDRKSTSGQNILHQTGGAMPKRHVAGAQDRRHQTFNQHVFSLNIDKKHQDASRLEIL